MKVVLDTNVFVSGVFFSAPAATQIPPPVATPKSPTWFDLSAALAR